MAPLLDVIERSLSFASLVLSRQEEGADARSTTIIVVITLVTVIVPVIAITFFFRHRCMCCVMFMRDEEANRVMDDFASAYGGSFMRRGHRIAVENYRRRLQEKPAAYNKDIKKVLLECRLTNREAAASLPRNWSCAICLDDKKYTRSGILRLPCEHFLHGKCMRKWMYGGGTSCPLCNHVLIHRITPQESNQNINEPPAVTEREHEQAEEAEPSNINLQSDHLQDIENSDEREHQENTEGGSIHGIQPPDSTLYVPGLAMTKCDVQQV